MVDPSPALPAIAAAVAPDTDQLLPTPKLFTVLVVGDIHEGKSQLIDALCDTSSDQIGPEILEVGGIRSNGDGTTKGCPSYRGRVLQGRRIKIFDSPGISDGTAFLEEDPMTLTASNTEPDPDASVAAGTGGLLSLLEKTFHKNQINLVIVVHPCNKTGVQMGARVLRCLIDKGLVAGNEDAWENIVVAFTKADLLERMPKLERKAQRKQLVRVVLPLYFPHLFHPDGTPKPGAAPDKQYCFTTGVPVRPPHNPPV
jgi:predicted GTPase